MTGSEVEDYSQPILPGDASSDYERYINTDALLALKLAWNDAEEATRLIEEGDLRGALRLLRRSILCVRFLVPQLEMLEQMSPWEYQEIRKVLGHGSGFDSPGWNELRRILPQLGQAVPSAPRAAGVS